MAVRMTIVPLVLQMWCKHRFFLLNPCGETSKRLEREMKWEGGQNQNPQKITVLTIFRTK